MSTNICSYEGCMVRRLPCTSIAFFTFPSDSRREEWILNSGNKDLHKLDKRQRRFLCQEHFHPKDIRSQFNRKILRKDAIPIPHKSISKATTDIESRALDESSNEDRECSLIDQPSSFVDYSELLIEYDDDVESEKGELNLSSENGTHGIDVLDEETESELSNEVPTESIFGMDVIEEDEVNMEEAIETQTDDISNSIDIVLEGPPKAKNSSRAIVSKTHNYVTKQSRPNSPNGHEDDRNFALSLVGYFQRLSHEKKVVAKLKILSYLTALELGTNLDL